jgi:hypothetical protein
MVQAALEAPRILSLNSNPYFSGPYGKNDVLSDLINLIVSAQTAISHRLLSASIQGRMSFSSATTGTLALCRATSRATTSPTASTGMQRFISSSVLLGII